MVTSVLLGGWAGRLDGGEGLEDPVRMNGSSGDRPRVAGRQLYHRSLQVQLCPTTEDVADGLVLPRDLGLGLAGLLVLPQAHRDRLARRQVPLPHLALRRLFIPHPVYVALLRHSLLLDGPFGRS